MANEHDIAIFLVGLAVLLGVARLFGELARAARFPARKSLEEVIAKGGTSPKVEEAKALLKTL